MSIKFSHTSLEGVVVLIAPRFEDARGWFAETWNDRDARRLGLDFDFVQDNHSFSAAKGTLRGLHYQRPPRAQDKLVRCTRGSILDVCVDIRVGSPTFGRCEAIELSAGNGRQLLVPKGFLHGFVTLEPDTEVQYKCSDYYSPEHDGCVRWDSLDIPWGIESPVISAKDASAPPFSDFQSPFIYGAAP